MRIKYNQPVNASQGEYDASFKLRGTTYYIQMLEDGGNYVAKWWDSSDNGVGYNNQGWVALSNDFGRNTGNFSPENIESLLGVISEYDRKPGKPVQDRIKKEVAKLIDFDAINGACGGKSVKASRRAIKAGYWDAKQGRDGYEYTYDVDPNSLFMGLDGAYFIWLNNVADPWVEYNGNLYNANEVTDYLWEEYNEICQEEGMDATEDGFDAWIEPDFVESALMDSIPMAKVDFTSGNYRKAIKASRRVIKASKGNKIPYELVSMLVILRDWADVSDAYINDEHKLLVDIADGLYNLPGFAYNSAVDSLQKDYKEIYEKYGKQYFNKVLKDASAIDSQVNRNNVQDLVDEYNEKGLAFESQINASISNNYKAIKASSVSVKTEFQSFLDKVDRQVSNDLYQYDDAIWDVKGTISYGDNSSYWFELNLYCDGEEVGTVNIEYNGGSFATSTNAYVVSVPDSDEIQAEGNSFDDIFDTCVGELIRLAEDYVNFVRIKY